MVSNARLDLPEPESPVTTISLSRGISTEMFLRLWTRAPCTATVVRTETLASDCRDLLAIRGDLRGERDPPIHGFPRWKNASSWISTLLRLVSRTGVEALPIRPRSDRYSQAVVTPV